MKEFAMYLKEYINMKNIQPINPKIIKNTKKKETNIIVYGLFIFKEP